MKVLNKVNSICATVIDSYNFVNSHGLNLDRDTIFSGSWQPYMTSYLSSGIVKVQENCLTTTIHITTLLEELWHLKGHQDLKSFRA